MQLNSSLVRRKDMDLMAPFAKTILRGSHQFKSQELISNSGQNESFCQTVKHLSFFKTLSLVHLMVNEILTKTSVWKAIKLTSYAWILA